MDKLLTQQDLADRWQVSVRAIENWRKEGILQPAQGIPAIRFTPKHIAELEGVELERFSPLEKRRMESELEKLREENCRLKSAIMRFMAETAGMLYGGGESNERKTEATRGY